MATITISDQDVINADAYLATYLKEKIPDADFSQGSAIRDFVVKAIAHIFAYFRAEIQKTRNQQSILTLQQQPASTEVDEAVDALLSNLFIDRKTGLNSRVVATLHFTTRVDVVITPTTRFFRSGQTFTIDQTENLFIPAANLRSVQLTTAGALEFVTTVTLVCASTGIEGNVDPGRFSGADRFNAYFSYAENLDYGLGGKSTETTTDLLARAPTALSVRNLVNVRSVQAVLLDEFPELTNVFTAGFGDPEMTRDNASEGVTQINMHTGGHMDVYVKLPVVAVTTDDLTIGASAVRPDGVVNVFFDATANFLSGTAVVPGDVLKLHNGIQGAPREFIIKSVTATRIFVSERASFPAEVTGITYSIGAVAPLYSEKRSGSATGETVNYIQAANSVFLPGRPKGKLRKVEYTSDGGVTWASLERVNVLTPAAGQYAVEILTPTLYQSGQAVERLVVAAGSVGELKITYDTLTGFDTVSTRVTNAFERNVCANNLVRGYVPVYVAVLGTYGSKTGQAAVDDALLKQALNTFIYGWDVTQPLDVSSITEYLRATFTTINRFFNDVTLNFTVYTPDGQLYTLQTTDVVSLFPDGISNVTYQDITGTGLPLRDGDVLSLTIAQLQQRFLAAGVTQRNIRFFPDPDVTSITAYID